MTIDPQKAVERLQRQYKNQNNYIKNNYDRISLTLPKGTKDRIKAQGQSVNGFVNNLVLAELERLEHITDTKTTSSLLDELNF